MSIVNIIISIARQISYILLNKSMSKDIIGKILTKNENKNYKKNNLLIEQKNVINEPFKNIENNKINSDRKNIEYSSMDKQSVEEIMNKSNKINFNNTKVDESLKRIRTNQAKINIIKNLKIIHIIKSFFCFKDKKTKLIDLCHNIIIKDFCIDRILKRLYNLEKLYYLLSEEELYKIKLFKNKEFEIINKYLFQINNKIKKKNEQNKK